MDVHEILRVTVSALDACLLQSEGHRTGVATKLQHDSTRVADASTGQLQSPGAELMLQFSVFAAELDETAMRNLGKCHALEWEYILSSYLYILAGLQDSALYSISPHTPTTPTACLPSPIKA